jgi:drug/metabolite transporter (DMT)-like permease
MALGPTARLYALVVLIWGTTWHAIAYQLADAPPNWVALPYLALAGSAVAVAAFLALQQRVGAGKAATVGVTTPALAIVASAAFEG